MSSSLTGVSEAGLTPQIPIVTPSGTPTVFFFRWLLADRQRANALAASTTSLADDTGLLETFSLGESHAAVSKAAAATADAIVNSLFTDETGAMARSAGERVRMALEALIAAPAPLTVARPEIRDLLANIPGGFNAGDAGQLFTATDYQHRYRWTGSAWQFLEGDASGYMVMSKPDGTAPNGGLWGLCDGSAYNVAQSNGTVISVTTLNLTTAGQFLTTDTSGVLFAATQPTWQGGAVTEAENTHVHTITPPAALVDPDTGGAIIQPGSGTAITVASHPHQHTVTVTAFGSGPGTAHSHALSINARLNPPSDANGGLPARIGVRFYIRR